MIYLDGIQSLEIKPTTSFSRLVKLMFLVFNNQNMESETKKDKGSKRQLIF